MWYTWEKKEDYRQSQPAPALCMEWISIVGDVQECFPEHIPPSPAGVQEWEEEETGEHEPWVTKVFSENLIFWLSMMLGKTQKCPENFHIEPTVSLQGARDS